VTLEDSDLNLKLHVTVMARALVRPARGTGRPTGRGPGLGMAGAAAAHWHWQPAGGPAEPAAGVGGSQASRLRLVRPGAHSVVTVPGPSVARNVRRTRSRTRQVDPAPLRLTVTAYGLAA
jgi:hypothetical protein